MCLQLKCISSTTNLFFLPGLMMQVVSIGVIFYLQSHPLAIMRNLGQVYWHAVFLSVWNQLISKWGFRPRVKVHYFDSYKSFFFLVPYNFDHCCPQTSVSQMSILRHPFYGQCEKVFLWNGTWVVAHTFHHQLLVEAMSIHLAYTAH